MWACGAMASELSAAYVTGGDMSEPGTTTSVQRQAAGPSLQAAQTLSDFGVGEWLTRCTSQPARGLSWYWWRKHREGEPEATRNPCGNMHIPKALSVPLCYQTPVWF